MTPGRSNAPLTDEQLKKIDEDKQDLGKLYKQETPEEQLQWIRENTDYITGDLGPDDSKGPDGAGEGFDPNDDVPF